MKTSTFLALYFALFAPIAGIRPTAIACTAFAILFLLLPHTSRLLCFASAYAIVLMGCWGGPPPDPTVQEEPKLVWSDEDFDPEQREQRLKLYAQNLDWLARHPVGEEVVVEIENGRASLPTVLGSGVFEPAVIVWSGSWCPGTQTLEHFDLGRRVADMLEADLGRLRLADQPSGGEAADEIHRRLMMAARSDEAVRQNVLIMAALCDWDRESDTFTCLEMGDSKLSEALREAVADRWSWMLVPATPVLFYVQDGRVKSAFAGVSAPDWPGAETTAGFAKALREVPREKREERWPAMVASPLSDSEEAAAEQVAERIALYLQRTSREAP